MNNRNLILAVILSVVVLFGWQILVIEPMNQRTIEAQQQAAQAAGATATDGIATPTAAGPTTTAAELGLLTREQAIAASPRVVIDTAALIGSINLVGGRLDDLLLKNYHEKVDKSSPIVTLLSPANTLSGPTQFAPAGAPIGYVAEQGWVAVGGTLPIPADALWAVEGTSTRLTETTPVTLVWDNGQGLVFRRLFEVDEHYLFTVTQSVENRTGAAVQLYPFSRVSRFGTPHTSNNFILHEGPVGVLDSFDRVEITYSDVAKDQRIDAKATGGWLGFTDKYWAAAVFSEPTTPISARYFHRTQGALDVYEASFVDEAPLTVAPGATGSDKSYVFAGAKVESIIDSYEKEYGFDRAELLIDWGWFHFLTKPMFYLIRLLHGLLGNFGLAILAVTVLVKAVFFPLANRSYASMAAMRRVQPEQKAIQERHKDDRMEMQKAIMDLYKREKINPLSGCWPILIQIPVFFALYKVLFVTIEMRHAPFFGWIQDLADRDPTTIFNLFGLLPFDPLLVPLIGGLLAVGVWPILMGVTMWVQLKLQPPPPDPTQAFIFAWMPLLFVFMLGTFPAGLVIYWTWNNLLSVAQQWFIMRRHGVKVDLFGNIIQTFRRKPAAGQKGS